MIAIDLERLSIRLRGVARPVAEAAMDGLGEELGRRLARESISTLPTGDVFRIDIRDLKIADTRDVTAIRQAIAARVVRGLTETRHRREGDAL